MTLSIRFCRQYLKAQKTRRLYLLSWTLSGGTGRSYSPLSTLIFARPLIGSSQIVNFCYLLSLLTSLDAVFFANYIGDDQQGHEDPSVLKNNTFPASRPLSSIRGNQDLRCGSMREAVKFAKSNNLLGLICQAKLLVFSISVPH